MESGWATGNKPDFKSSGNGRDSANAVKMRQERGDDSPESATIVEVRRTVLLYLRLQRIKEKHAMQPVLRTSAGGKC